MAICRRESTYGVGGDSEGQDVGDGDGSIGLVEVGLETNDGSGGNESGAGGERRQGGGFSLSYFPLTTE
jgi:hypothetical protein